MVCSGNGLECLPRVDYVTFGSRLVLHMIQYHVNHAVMSIGTLHERYDVTKRTGKELVSEYPEVL